MSLSPGDKLGPYEIVAQIGAGGMGEVYKARDTRLDRTVAIKVASEGFNERFEREARAIAAFSHPHICHLYDVGPNYLVMELVDGEPLKGPMPPAKAVAHANQILDALTAAHRKGIVHRDLKPANILLTKQGIKLLDFGLAKHEGPLRKLGDETVTAALTGGEQIVGTLQYMAPEQLQNRETDTRADLFAFGCVLYEMLSGRRAFEGDSAASVIGSILHREPERLEIGAPLDRVIRRCLAKDPDDRFQTARDLQYNLTLAMEPEAPAAATALPSHSKLPWIAWGVLAVAAAMALWAPWRSVPAPQALLRMSEEIPAGLEIVTTMLGSSPVAIAADGTRLAISLRGADRTSRIHTRLLRETAWKQLDGTEGGYFPFFSPDGAWIAFVADNKLKKISAAGGAPADLGPMSNNGFRGASWARDGYIYYSQVSGELLRIPVAGGPAEHLAKGKPLLAGFWPQVLPGGKSVLVTESSFDIDAANIRAVALATGEMKTVHQGGFSAMYREDEDGAGRLVYLHGSSLMAAPFDLGRLATKGSPQALVEGVGSAPNRGGNFTMSDTGILAYVPGKAERNAPTPISWLDRSGNVSPLYSTPAVYNNPRISPDGRKIAYAVSTASGIALWVKDLDRDTPTKLSFLEGNSDWPVWTPDSRSIVFTLVRADSAALYGVDADGSSPPELLSRNGRVAQGLGCFTLDGRKLIAARSGPSMGLIGGFPSLAIASIEGEKGHRKLSEFEPLLPATFDERHPAISPDGKWLAYDSVEAGPAEVYVRPLRADGAVGAGKWRVSNGSGLHPIWFRNGRELLYHNPASNRAMVVGYSDAGGEFKTGTPEPWSNTPLQGSPVFRFYDLSPDGKRLAVVGLSEDLTPPQPANRIGFLINWPGALSPRQ